MGTGATTRQVTKHVPVFQHPLIDGSVGSTKVTMSSRKYTHNTKYLIGPLCSFLVNVANRTCIAIFAVA